MILPSGWAPRARKSKGIDVVHVNQAPRGGSNRQEHLLYVRPRWPLGGRDDIGGKGSVWHLLNNACDSALVASVCLGLVTIVT
jgi:hypothetical protein